MPTQSSTTPYTHFNPITVRMSESAGIIFLGIISLILLVALLRAQARNRVMSG